MLRGFALAASVLLVAGCSSNPSDAPVAPTPAFTSTAQPAVPQAPALTDTMHLLGRPHVTGMAPTGSEPIRVPVEAGGMPVTVAPATEDASWSMPRPSALAFLAGTATIWVDIQGTVTNSNPGDACFWRASLVAPSQSSAGSLPGVSTTNHFDCASEPAVVAPGVRSLTFDFPGYDLTEPGDSLVLRLVADNGIAAPGATIHVLTGTPQYDSTVTVYGLQLPLTTQTLLV